MQHHEWRNQCQHAGVVTKGYQTKLRGTLTKDISCYHDNTPAHKTSDTLIDCFFEQADHFPYSDLTFSYSPMG